MAVSKRLRFEILRRDNHACRYCGAAAPEATLTVDHVIPVALGGTDEPSNLVTACGPCNSGKSATPADAPIVDDVAADALRWSAAMERAASIARTDRAADKWFMADFQAAWDEWGYEFRGEQRSFDLPADWEESVIRFRDAGISIEDFREAVRIAMRKKTAGKFPYMCGILWRWISERQQIAMEIVRGEESEKA